MNNLYEIPMRGNDKDIECLVSNIEYLTRKSGRLYDEGKISLASAALVPYGDAINESSLPRRAVATSQLIAELSVKKSAIDVASGNPLDIFDEATQLYGDLSSGLPEGMMYDIDEFDDNSEE